jgi:hypothetical protein
MTSEDADNAQNWLSMDGATAWHLIDRHANNWNEVGELMNAWLRANVLAEREACAKAAEGFTDDRDDRKWVPGSLYDTLRRETAAFIRKRSNATVRGWPVCEDERSPND